MKSTRILLSLIALGSFLFAAAQKKDSQNTANQTLPAGFYEGMSSESWLL